MAEIKETKITDIIQDDRNLNKGTEQGKQMITKSLQKFGAGRSILIDKNNRIIAGNKTHENAQEIGMDDVLVVETDGSQLVAVKRTDIDLDTTEGREMALADNATVKVDLSWDYIPKKCFAYWCTITVRWDGMVQYCCNRVNDIVGHIMDEDILRKKKEYRIKLSECDRPCRLSGANRYLEQWKKDEDVFFV